MAGQYDELLLLCGYEQEEIDEERGRIDETFRRLGLGDSDYKNGIERVNKYYQVEMLGVRKLLGAYLKELTDVILAGDEGKKCIYFGFPAMLGPALILKAAAGDKLMAVAPDVIIAHTMGLIFDKHYPIIQAGEQNGLPPGHALCSLWQIKIGGLAMGIIPPPDFNFSSGYFCDMSAIGDSLVRAKYGTPAGIIDSCMDGRLDEYPNIRPERVKFLGQQIKDAMDMAQEVLDIKVEEEHFEKGLNSTWNYRKLCAELCDVMNSDPVPLSMTAVDLIEAIPACSSGRGVREAAKALEILIPELKEKVARGEGIAPKGAPRIMLLHGNMADPRMTLMTEDAGLACPMTYIMAWNGGIKIDVKQDYGNPYDNMAEVEFALSMPFGGDATAKVWAKAVKLTHLDGLIMKHLHHCRPATSGYRIAKDHLEDLTGIPVLDMDEDLCDNRVYGPAYMKTKLETFAEMLRARKKWQTIEDDWTYVD